MCIDKIAVLVTSFVLALAEPFTGSGSSANRFCRTRCSESRIKSYWESCNRHGFGHDRTCECDGRSGKCCRSSRSGESW